MRAAETGTAVSEPRALSVRMCSEKRYVIVASTRLGKPKRAGNSSTQSLIRIILICIDTIVNPDSCTRRSVYGQMSWPASSSTGQSRRLACFGMWHPVQPMR